MREENLKGGGQGEVQSRDLEGLEGKSVTLTGWIDSFRQLGKITFVIMGDPEGNYQAVAREEMARKIVQVPRQSYIKIWGPVARGQGKASPFEVRIEGFEVINSADTVLPIDPASKVNSELTTRVNNRPLDLRVPEERAVFLTRAKAMQIIREFLTGSGFVEVDTPKIIATASEGGAELFKFDYFGRPAYLAQSPQLYKEELVLSLGKVFEIAHYFRAEKSNTVKHLNEFTSVDIEAAMAMRDDAMKLIEGLVREMYRGLEVNYAMPERFPVYTYEDIVNHAGLKFGDDLSSEVLNDFGRGKGYYFIVDWPISLKPFYTMPKGDALSESFDLMYGGLEIASGGQRIHQHEMLYSRLKASGLDPESFSEHLKAYRWGMPPHSGWGMGLDRLLMVLMNRENIREVVLYPRDSRHLAP
ncbi:MAG: aspartate--tRNA(Asn) ligase [Thaumarchaeota archaeon]|nr:aspartate--tRNA(Asn) ligase [Nitrososphaerota archaeon]